MREPERELAKCKGFDLTYDRWVGIQGTFYYEGGSAQGIGWIQDLDFMKQFMRVFNVEKLQQVNGRSCWVTHDNSTISLIEPLHKDDGKAFDVMKWSEDARKKESDLLGQQGKEGAK